MKGKDTAGTRTVEAVTSMYSDDWHDTEHWAYLALPGEKVVRVQLSDGDDSEISSSSMLIEVVLDRDE